jgi:hypothetical protein
MTTWLLVNGGVVEMPQPPSLWVEGARVNDQGLGGADEVRQLDEPFGSIV